MNLQKLFDLYVKNNHTLKDVQDYADYFCLLSYKLRLEDWHQLILDRDPIIANSRSPEARMLMEKKKTLLLTLRHDTLNYKKAVDEAVMAIASKEKDAK